MKQLLAIFVTIAVASLLLYACIRPISPAMVAAIPEITVMAHEYAFDLPKAIPAGLVRVRFEVHGQEPHHAQFARLNDGVTFEQFVAALQKGENEALPLITFPGGAAPIDPGSKSSVVINLPVGNYVMLCFVPSPDGVPHLAKGMVTPFTVVESQNQAPEPEAQATIKLVDFSFVLPTDIKAGKQIWKVVNEGSQIHEINLMKLAEGKTIEDVMAWAQKPEGQPPFANVGGYNGMDPKATGWIDLDLTPGDYIAICHVPDPATGKAHELLGMVLPFTVQ